MMRSAKTLSLLLLAAAVVLVVPGCFKVKQEFTVYPDGSGKMEIRTGFNAKAIEDALGALGGQMGGGGGMGGPDIDDPTEITIEDLDEDMQGFVAFTRPKVEETADGWTYVSFTGYFEDVNKVKIYGEGEGDEKSTRATMSFEATDNGYVLTIQNRLGPGDQEKMDELDEVPPEMAGMVQAMMDMMLQGFSMEERYHLPGEILEVEGIPVHEGRVASRKIEQGDIQSMADLKKIAQTNKIRIVCGASQVDPEEMREFKMELEQAKADWAKIKAEAAAAAEEDDGAGKDDEDK
jgi:hypothetical protein